VVVEVELFISCADDVEPLRDITQSVMRLLEHMFLRSMGQSVIIYEWDFRIDPPGVVPAGSVAARSLTMVERSQGLIAILGERIGAVSRKEIRRAFELRVAGQPVQVWTFLNPALKSTDHEALFEEIKKDFDLEIVYTEYADPTEFQGKLFITLIPYLLERVETTVGPLFSPRTGP
jgi:hypothetical protein